MKEIQATGATLVGISYDEPEVLGKFVTRRKIEFPLLSDTGSRTIKAYGLYREDTSGRQQGIPHPLTIVVGTDGMIKAKLGFEG